jgi:glycosyltransferase involved in cell wall biosynthesis
MNEPLDYGPMYWLKGEKVQNFGDFLAEYLFNKLFLPASISSDGIWIIGSCIDDHFVDLTLNRGMGKAIFWGCGLRNRIGLSESSKNNCDILSVRGPLSKSILSLSDKVPLGDPGLLLPALYKPKHVSKLKSSSILVPHFHDSRSDEELLRISECNVILRPNLKNKTQEIHSFLDQLTSAEFVLCGSLHAAVAAAAYEKPFGFWDSGNIDLPFKWKDFAALLSIECRFLSNIKEAKVYFQKYINNKIIIPRLSPMLAVAPYAVRCESMMKVLHLDYIRYGESVISEKYLKTTSSEIAQGVTTLYSSLQNKIDDQGGLIERLNQSIVERDQQIGAINSSVIERDQQIGAYQKLIDDQGGLIERLNQSIDERDQLIKTIYATKSWRYTHTFRDVNFKLSSLSKLIKRKFQNIPQKILLTKKTQYSIKSFIYINFYYFFKNTQSYKFWYSTYYFANLKQNPIPLIEENLKITDKTKKRGKVLVVDISTPTPDRDSGSIDTWYYLKALIELEYEVVFIPENLLPMGVYTSNIRELGVRVFTHNEISKIEDFLIQEGDSLEFALLYRVHTARLQLPLIKKYAPRAKIIFDTVDLHYVREERQAKLSGEEHLIKAAEYTRIAEIQMMSEADATIILSEAEIELVRNEYPKVNAVHIPILREIPGRNNDFSSRKDIVFIGGFLHLPNVDAIKFFIAEIWPYVYQKNKSINLLIIGSNAPEEIVALGDECNNIQFIGHVENLDEYFNKCRVSIAPLRFGAGIKGKIVTSGSYGVPCVVSKIASEGMGLTPDEDVLVGEDPEDFANKLLDVYTDPVKWERISRNLLSKIEENYSYNSVKRKISDLFFALSK